MAALEIVALDTATPQLRAPASGDTYVANRKIAIQPEANSNALAVTGFSLTGANAQSLMSLAGTWNTTGAPTGIKLNVIDNASNAASLLMDLQKGGTGMFAVDKTGMARVTGGLSGSYASQFTEVAIAGPPNAAIALIGGTSAQGISVRGAAALAWVSGTNPGFANRDLFLVRDAADTLALQRGTNAQALRLYNTFTDASNYERGFARWNANVFEIGTAAAGTGTVRDLSLVPGAGGSIRMGTHTAIGAETVTGYITIKDAGGTARKLAVVS